MKIRFEREQLHVSEMSGKLKGIAAISTDPMSNPFCMRQVDSSEICSKCYAKNAITHYRKVMQPLLKKNLLLLEQDIESKDIPVIDEVVALRFNSFGELHSRKALANFVSIATKNRHLPVALWTKRSEFVCEYIFFPENLVVIYSSPKIDEPVEIPQSFHKVFTVFSSKEKLLAHPEIFPCQDNCAKCLTCYKREGPSKIGIVLHR